MARPLRPEDLDSRVTRHGIYPLLPAPNSVPWSEYVRTQRNRSRSISPSTEALESDHARYVTRRIVQHARTMATGTRSLPTDSPVPPFQPIERGYFSEGLQEDMTAPFYVDPSEQATNKSSNKYHSKVFEIDSASTYMGLDYYDTLFAAKHGRAALDPAPTKRDQQITESLGISPPISGPELINQMERVIPTHVGMHTDQRELVSLPKETVQLRVILPSSGIIGEGAAIFTDMTETILDTLDCQVAMAPDAQPTKSVSSMNDQTKKKYDNILPTSDQKEKYPDLFLPVAENYRISDCFYGDSDSLSVDNNPMVLLMLNNLAYHYGTSVYAVDRVNGTMYGKFSMGIKSYLKKPW